MNGPPQNPWSPMAAQQPQQSAPAVDNTPVSLIRICLSKSLTCSGCNPCDACLGAVRARVLPPAMLAAGFANSAEQAQAFFTAYTRGWAEFRLQIQQMVALGQMQGLDGRIIYAGLQLLQQQQEAATAPTEAAPPSPGVDAPPINPVNSDVNATEPAEVADAHPPPVPAPSADLQLSVTPLTSSDIAAALVPVTVSPAVRIANVMDVPLDVLAEQLSSRNGSG